MGAFVNLLVKPASGLCNMRCKYCFYADVMNSRTQKSYGLMNADTQQAMVTGALRSAKLYCGFAFQGGEPTLAGIDYYRRLIKLQRNYNVNNVKIGNSIQTNGYSMNDEWAKFFAENKFLVGLSLDGEQIVHDGNRKDANGEGTFSKVMKAAELLKKHGVEFNILSVVSADVAKRGKETYEFFKSKGFKYIQFIPCLDEFGSEGNLEYSLTAEAYGKFLRDVFDCYYRDFMRGDFVSIRNFDNYVIMAMGRNPESCGMTGVCSCYFMVEADGSVYPCDYYVIDKYRLGNLNIQTFEQIANTVTANEFVKESRYVDSKCRKCSYLNICRGGCRRNREPFVNGKPSLNKFCNAYEEFFGYCLARIGEMAKKVNEQGGFIRKKSN